MTDGAQNISSYLLSALSLPDLDCAVLHSASVQITLAETPLPSPPSDAQSLIYQSGLSSDPSLSARRVDQQMNEFTDLFFAGMAPPKQTKTNLHMHMHCSGSVSVYCIKCNSLKY